MRLLLNRSNGFTLLEMMVVIGIIAIITQWAVPGIKKAYEDFKVKETYSHIDTFITSFRSYYLVRSEFPADSTPDLVKKNYVWCLPSNFYKRTEKNANEYYIHIKPYEGTSYDVDAWITSSSQNFHMTLWTNVPDKWYERLIKRYDYVLKRTNYMTIEDFREINFGIAFEESYLRNRYY